MSVYFGWLLALAFGYSVYRLLTIGQHVHVKPEERTCGEHWRSWSGHNVHSAGAHPPPNDPGPGCDG